MSAETQQGRTKMVGIKYLRTPCEEFLAGRIWGSASTAGPASRTPPVGMCVWKADPPGSSMRPEDCLHGEPGPTKARSFNSTQVQNIDAERI